MIQKTFRPRITLRVVLLSAGILFCIASISYRVYQDAVYTGIAMNIANENSDESRLDGDFYIKNLKQNAIPLLLIIFFSISLSSLLKRKIVFDADSITISGYRIEFADISCFDEDILSTRNNEDHVVHLEEYSADARMEIVERLKPFSLQKKPAEPKPENNKQETI